MANTPEGLNQWAERLLAAALDREAYKLPGWHADAQTFLAEVKKARRSRELGAFAVEFDAGYQAGRSGVRAILAEMLDDLDATSCTYRTVGAVAGVALGSNAPALEDELETMYALAAGLLTAMDEAGVRVRSEAFTADQALVRRIKALEKTLDGMLRHFVLKGRPGYPAVQSNWVPETTVAEWRAVLAAPLPTGDDTAVIDRVPDGTSAP